MLSLLWEFGSDCYYRGKIPFQNLVISSFRVCIALSASKNPTKPNKNTKKNPGVFYNPLVGSRGRDLSRSPALPMYFWYQHSPHFGSYSGSVEEDKCGRRMGMDIVNYIWKYVFNCMGWSPSCWAHNANCLFYIAKMQISFIAWKTRQSSQYSSLISHGFKSCWRSCPEALNSQEQRLTFSSTKLNVNIWSWKNRRLISDSPALKAVKSDITCSSKLSAGLAGHSYLPNDTYMFVNIYSREKSWCCGIETAIAINQKKKQPIQALCVVCLAWYCARNIFSTNQLIILILSNLALLLSQFWEELSIWLSCASTLRINSARGNLDVCTRVILPR